MIVKLGALALGLLATTAIAFGALGGTASAAAEPESDSAQIDAAIASGDHTRLPTWLRNSIIACAAETIDVSVSEVKAGLRHGYSLKEIATRHGVRPPELKRGILSCEQHLLLRMVEAGKLSRHEAHRILNFLEEHINQIINHHYATDDHVIRDAAITDVAPSDVRVTDEAVTDVRVTDVRVTDAPVRD